MIEGTVGVLLAEALLLPSSVVTAMVLTRGLGPTGYGQLTLAAALINWIEVGIALIFSPIVIKLVSENEDWRPIGTAAVRLYLAVSGIGVLILWLLAPAIAEVLRDPSLILYVRLYALEIPLFNLARAHQNILVGTGRFREQAFLTAGRWLARMVLIVCLVEMGFSVPGAILGSVGASGVELAMGRFYVRPSLFGKTHLSTRAMWGLGGPLFLSVLSVYLHNKLDVVALKLLGGTAGQAGLYGAAQNLSFVPGLLAVSFPPVLLSILNRLRHAGETLKAREISQNSLRVVVWLMPFGAMTAGAAPEIVVLLFGPKFSSAAPLLSFLIFAALAAVMISVTSAELIAANRTGWTLALTGPLAPLAILGHFVMIPRFGSLGACLVTTTVAGLGALGGLTKVCQVWNFLPPFGTFARSLFLCALAFAAAALWPVSGFWLFIKLPLIGSGIAISFLLLGEFRKEEIVLFLSMITSKKSFRFVA